MATISVVLQRFHKLWDPRRTPPLSGRTPKQNVRQVPIQRICLLDSKARHKQIMWHPVSGYRHQTRGACVQQVLRLLMRLRCEHRSPKQHVCLEHFSIKV